MVEIELCCPRCMTRFAAPPLAPPEEVHGRMIEQGGWFGLAGEEKGTAERKRGQRSL